MSTRISIIQKWSAQVSIWRAHRDPRGPMKREGHDSLREDKRNEKRQGEGSILAFPGLISERL